jgi:hypothetical protein
MKTRLALLSIVFVLSSISACTTKQSYNPMTVDWFNQRPHYIDSYDETLSVLSREHFGYNPIAVAISDDNQLAENVYLLDLATFTFYKIYQIKYNETIHASVGHINWSPDCKHLAISTVYSVYNKLYEEYYDEKFVSITIINQNRPPTYLNNYPIPIEGFYLDAVIPNERLFSPKSHTLLGWKDTNNLMFLTPQLKDELSKAVMDIPLFYNLTSQDFQLSGINSHSIFSFDFSLVDANQMLAIESNSDTEGIYSENPNEFYNYKTFLSKFQFDKTGTLLQYSPINIAPPIIDDIKLYDKNDYTQISLSPDGENFFLQISYGLKSTDTYPSNFESNFVSWWVAYGNTNNPEMKLASTNVPSSQNEMAYYHPMWLPDSQKILQRNRELGGVCVYDIETKEEKCAELLKGAEIRQMSTWDMCYNYP